MTNEQIFKLINEKVYDVAAKAALGVLMRRLYDAETNATYWREKAREHETQADHQGA